MGVGEKISRKMVGLQRHPVEYSRTDLRAGEYLLWIGRSAGCQVPDPVYRGTAFHDTSCCYEVLAIVLAAVFGADFALTEASLSALLKDVEKMHTEFVERAQSGVEKEKVQGGVASLESLVNREKLAMEERIDEAKKSLSKHHAGQLTFNQRRILVSIERFMPDKNRTTDQNKDRLMLTGELKSTVRTAMKSKDHES